MDKTFSEVFPNIKGKREVEGLLPLIDVCRLKYSEGKEFLLVYLRIRRLVDKNTVFELERLIDEEYLAELPTRARIIETYELPTAYRLPELIDFYRESMITELTDGMPIDRRFLTKAEWNVTETEIGISIEDHPISRGNERIWTEKITRIINERFGYEVRVTFTYQEKKEHNYVIKHEDVVYIDAPKPAEKAEEPGKTQVTAEKNVPAAKANKPITKKTDSPKKNDTPKESGGRPASGALRRGGKDEGSVKAAKRTFVSDDPNHIYGRPFDDEIKEIGSYGASEEGTMVIHGEILSQEVRELRNGERSILAFSLSDYTDTINVKLFISNEDAPEMAKKLSPGNCIKMKGLAQFDTFDKELSIRSVQGIFKIEKNFTKSREDHATVKRVELHCHTKASENDGMTEASKLIKQAAKWGHKAMAITDHGCVYAFPEAYHTVEKMDFKVLYGMEGYLVDDTKKVVVKPGNLSIDAPCVVFDIETTGFSPVKNKIIEIGAVKIEGGKVIDRFSTFVNPGMPIPYRIENLTGISDAMVRDADDIAAVLPRFLEFTKDCYLVAHNAEFDVTFITENAKRLGLFDEPYTYADTVGISRVLLPQLARYRLDNVAKELGVSLENHHRAVDDAECTAMIYLKLLDRLRNRNLFTLADVQQAMVPTPDVIKKMPTYHVVLLASNELGRVNLYHLVSESSLNYFRTRPRIPKSLLEQYREGLIIGSACVSGEVFNAVLEGASDEEIHRLVDFYDYLEIQPLGNNMFLLNKDNDVTGIEDLQNLNRRIVELGEQYNKPVCATCDVHFLNPEDGIYREILQHTVMHSKGNSEEAEDEAPLYLRTTEEMLKEFDYLGADKAYEVVVANTNMIADRVEKIAPVRPDKCPPKIDNDAETLRKMCYKKARETYGDPLPEIVEKRLERELNAIISNGYAVMYMIAQKLVNKSVSDGYLVGSRGSVGSSFAATMSGITEVNPLPPHYRCPHCLYSDFDSETVQKYVDNTGSDMPDMLCPKCGKPMMKDGYNIPFETFMGFKGNKEPDIDLNFSGEYQSKAHSYTEVIFGKGQTFKAGTIGTVAEKTAYGYTLHYYEDKGIEKRRCEIERVAHHLEGVRASSGQHPGGIIVLPIGEDINTFTPIQHPANKETNIVTTHFDYHSIDSNLLKLDILGHDDPTMIRMLQDLIGIDPRSFPLDSPEVMELFRSTDSLGVTPDDIHGCPLGAMGLPEFGTDNAINMLLETKPQYVSDLIRISGLSHGTNVWHGNAQTLINEGKCTIQTAVCTRDDIMMYLISKGVENEQSFKIMEAVRKGRVAKGKCSEWPEWKQDMIDHGVPDWYIWSCEHIEYMFPKAHAAAYVMMALRIAYCKVFYPLAYYCAYFSIRANGFNYELMCQGREVLEHNLAEMAKKKDELNANEKDQYRDIRIVQEMYARGYSFIPIDIYRVSSTRFQIIDDKHIMPSLTSISGMGEVAADTAVEAAKKGPFTSLGDFKTRTKVSQTLIDLMVDLHILDTLPKEDQFSFFDKLM